MSPPPSQAHGLPAGLLRVVRHERLTTLAASVRCWHARPLGRLRVLKLAPRCSPWRLQSGAWRYQLTSRMAAARPENGARDPPYLYRSGRRDILMWKKGAP
jgi:hypothetical protein